MDYQSLLSAAMEEAKAGLAEGGIPTGAVLADAAGRILGRGRNRRVQTGDPTAHAAVDAFRAAGRLRGYRDKVLVSTLAPGWLCCGVVRQFNIGTVVIGESENFRGALDSLWDRGVRV